MKITQTITTLLIGLLLCGSNTYANDEVMKLKKDANDAATKLNQDWKKTDRIGCNSDEPDYYCSGVIAHVFDDYDDQESSNHPWSPSTKSITNSFVSFSYLRQDISGGDLLFPWGASGYIFSPIADLTDSKKYKLSCEYPVDSFAPYRTDQGCGYDPQYSHYFNVGCSNAGVKTSEDYLKAIKAPEPVCSASPDQAGFKMMLETIKKLKADPLHYNYPGWNELVIQEWSNKKNEDVPIEAFFYEINNGISDPLGKGKAAADSAARLYHEVTGIDVPVVVVDVHKLAVGDDSPFSNEIQ